MVKSELPICPLMTVSSGGIDMVCIQDRCAWYVGNVKKCSMYMLAYDALLSATEKQKKGKSN